MMKNIEDLIRNNIVFNYKQSAKGFNPVICAVCNDYKPRGGFKFENNQIIYNCFNCSTVSKYDEADTTMSDSFRKVLNSFGVSSDSINEVLASKFISRGKLSLKKTEEKDITLESLHKKHINTFVKEIELPKNSYPINESDERCNEAIKYLKSRKVFKNDFFYLNDEEYFKDRILIPFTKFGKLIYWQGRTYKEGDIRQRYINPSVTKDAIVFGYDELYRHIDDILFVTEGVFDAITINGVAIIGSKLNETKIEVLSKSKRRLVFILDRDKNGSKLGKKVLDNGWEITFPPEGLGDVNKAVVNAGLSWTVYNLIKNIPHSRVLAEILIKRNENIDGISKAKIIS